MLAVARAGVLTGSDYGLREVFNDARYALVIAVSLPESRVRRCALDRCSAGSDPIGSKSWLHERPGSKMKESDT